MSYTAGSWTKSVMTAGMGGPGTLGGQDKIGRVDKERLMVLRTTSNFAMPPPRISAAENLLKENEGSTGIDLAVETAYIVGSVVIDDDSCQLGRVPRPDSVRDPLETHFVAARPAAGAGGAFIALRPR